MKSVWLFSSQFFPIYSPYVSYRFQLSLETANGGHSKVIDITVTEDVFNKISSQLGRRNILGIGVLNNITRQTKREIVGAYPKLRLKG